MSTNPDQHLVYSLLGDTKAQDLVKPPLILDLQELWDNECMLFQATELMAISYVTIDTTQKPEGEGDKAVSRPGECSCMEKGN